MTSPNISVILPSYNYAEYLPETLESLARQTFPSWELVAVDDGSTDGSLDILRAFAETRPGQARILTHPNNDNRGLAETLQTAIENCHGDIVAFLEADDIWVPRALALYSSASESCPEAVVVHGAAQMFGDAELVQQRSEQYRWKGFPSPKTTGCPYEALPFLLRGNVTMTLSSIAVRREALLSLDWNTPHDAWLDWWLLSQLSARGQFFYEPSPVVRWRLHRKSYNVQYGERIQDLEKESRIYIAEIRRMLVTALSNDDGGIDSVRRRAVTRILEGADCSERSRGSAVLRAAKRMFPSPVKNALKRIFFEWRMCYNQDR